MPQPDARSATRAVVPKNRWLRPAFQILGRAAPELAARIAERLFFTPPKARRSRGEAVLQEGRRFAVKVGPRRVVAWQWGHGPRVLLLHGWAGRAAQLTSFVEPLVARGFSVVALDAPGHGASPRGRSSAPAFAAALRAVVRERGAAHAVVAHSLGAAATALALRGGLPLARVALLGPAAHPPAWFEPFAELVGLPAPIAARVRSLSEERLGLRWDELNVPSLARRFETGALIVHDLDDAEVPFADGVAIARAWPGARLLETRGLGHHRILRDVEVIASVVGFLAEGLPACTQCGRLARPGGGLCEGCHFEQHLFDRDQRSSAFPALA